MDATVNFVLNNVGHLLPPKQENAEKFSMQITDQTKKRFFFLSVVRFESRVVFSLFEIICKNKTNKKIIWHRDMSNDEFIAHNISQNVHDLKKYKKKKKEKSIYSDIYNTFIDISHYLCIGYETVSDVPVYKYHIYVYIKNGLCELIFEKRFVDIDFEIHDLKQLLISRTYITLTESNNLKNVLFQNKFLDFEKSKIAIEFDMLYAHNL